MLEAFQKGGGSSSPLLVSSTEHWDQIYISGFYKEKNAEDTTCSDDSGRRTYRKCDGAGVGCRLFVAFGTQGIPAALDAATQRARADKDQDCMKVLLIPEARMIFVSLGTGGAPTYRIETLDAGPAMSGEFL